MLASLGEVGGDGIGAADEHEAVRAFLSRRPDLIMTETCMPSLSGLEACSEIRRLEASANVSVVPIVMIAATAGELFPQRSAARGRAVPRGEIKGQLLAAIGLSSDESTCPLENSFNAFDGQKSASYLASPFGTQCVPNRIDRRRVRFQRSSRRLTAAPFLRSLPPAILSNLLAAHLPGD